MPVSTLSSLQMDWAQGLSEQQLQGKFQINNIHINEHINLTVFVPRMFEVYSVSLVTYGPANVDDR